MKILPNLSKFLPYSPALATGILLTAAFPDAALYPAAFFALVPLWAALAAMTPRQAFYAGLAAGTAHYLTLIYWIVPTLTQFGKLPMVAALGCLVLLALYLALYPALFALAMKKLPVPGWLTPFWGAAVWTGLEYIRTYALTGFPWGVLGYSQYANRLLVQVADISGVLGISFILVVCNGILTQTLLVVRKKTDAGSAFALSAGLGLALVAGALGYGSARLETVAQWTAQGEKTKISIIQGNIEQDKKWDNAFKDFTLDRYEALSLSALPADLVVWPETALPFYYGRDRENSSRVEALVQRAGTYFLVGSPAVEVSKENIRYYNRAYMFNGHSLVTGTYDKAHLVPFGEYVPLQDLLWFVEKLTAQAGNFSIGTTGPIPLAFGTHKTGVLICFEILFPGISRQFVLNGADILTTITNDAWFGRTSAPAQHFAIAVLRAVENRRAMIRAANTGISGVIDPSGRPLAATGLFTEAALTREVPALKQTSFYTRHGDLTGMAALVALTLGFMVKLLKNKRMPGRKPV
ncbi:MAG: apolipoprotein N-acyltransferase [Desulfobacter sp.]|nr:MAG: apolipoprotein N-acyltransferase [Desulfobacter sp.]